MRAKTTMPACRRVRAPVAVACRDGGGAAADDDGGVVVAAATTTRGRRSTTPRSPPDLPLTPFTFFSGKNLLLLRLVVVVAVVASKIVAKNPMTTTFVSGLASPSFVMLRSPFGVSFVADDSNYCRPLAWRRRNRLPSPKSPSRRLWSSKQGGEDDSVAATTTERAQQMLAKAKALREEVRLVEEEKKEKKETADHNSGSPSAATATVAFAKSTSPFDLPSAAEDENETSAEYRLYVDIGREPGTWMDPRWGASGRRIEFTLDVRFDTTDNAVVEASLAKAMIQDNLGGRKSDVRPVASAPYARLNGGFGEMKCAGGAYQIDDSASSKGQSSTVRFLLSVQGTQAGDVTVPEGNLYFSIPAFGNPRNVPKLMTQLSSKSGLPVTVRQIGWHTGWRREESRIIGIFRAVPLNKAGRR